MQTKRVVFRHNLLPYLLCLPQLAITLVFFIWPALQALTQSTLRQDAFGLSTQFVGLANFAYIFSDPGYLASVRVTVVFSIATAALAMGAALVFAVVADRVVRGTNFYRTILIWPYAVAPAVAGVLWYFLFNPSLGIATFMLSRLGIGFNPLISSTDAMTMVVIAASWKQVSYNFLFFLAGLQAIPNSVFEAAAIDGAGPVKRFWTIVLPLLSPTTFFLLVVNIVYAFFETFPIIHATTHGGPGQSTSILVYKVWRDGFVAQDLGSSAAQSVVLMAIVIALTVVQFRFIERRVEY